jgi:hypothetical protein
MWLDTPAQWDRLAEALIKAGEFGLDTETYGQPDKTSPQHRARIHCWSVGVLTPRKSPRGHRVAVGRVLPVEALFHPTLRAVLEDPAVKKWAHNAPHDRHSLNNHGIMVRSMEDTLQWLRVAMPGMGDYGLKGAERWALGLPPRPEFWDMMRYEAPVVKAHRRRERGCICGASPCRKPQRSEWLGDDGVWRPHLRVKWKVFTPETKLVTMYLEVPNFYPGATLPPLPWQGKLLDRWEQWLLYSASDAVHGIELVDWLRNQRPKQLEYPWQRRTVFAGPSVLVRRPAAVAVS